MPSVCWMSRASSGLSFSAPTIRCVIVLNWLRLAALQVQPRERGRAREQRHLVLLAELADRPGVERIEVINHLLVQAHGRPDRDREAERVEERQDPQQDLVGQQVDLLLDLMNVAEDVAVREHHPLGIAGRSRGEDHRRRRVQAGRGEAGQEAPSGRDGHQLGDGRGPELVGQRTCLGMSSSRISRPWA